VKAEKLAGIVGTLALLASVSNSLAADCSRPPPKCPAKSSEPYEPTSGDPLKRGTRRVVRVGDVFSETGGEGGGASMKILGQNDCGLWIETPTYSRTIPNGPRIPGKTVRECLKRSSDGAFRAKDDRGDGEAAQYALRQINSNCFEVTVEKDLAPYEGE